MWSKAGLLGMAFQAFINDVNLMSTNLQKLASGELEQQPATPEERHYYWLWWAIKENESYYKPKF